MALRKPNVLFITCDQWRGDSLSAAGHPVVRTPNVDALAAEGVLFRRHYAGAAPCSPARACLYTGLYQMNNRVCRNGTPLDDRHGNIARAARRVGYDPTLFGYTDVARRIHGIEHPAIRSCAPMKACCRASPCASFCRSTRRHGCPGSRRAASMPRAGYPGIHRPANQRAGRQSPALPVYSKDETPAAFLAGEFIRWLGEQDADEPWFAHLSFLSPHPPFIVPEPLQHAVRPGRGPGLPSRREPGGGGCGPPISRLPPRSSAEEVELPPRPEGQGARVGAKMSSAKIRALYYGMISEDRSATRPHLGSGQGSRRVGRHHRHPHLRPCRDDGRPFPARQRRLVRRQLPHPADHPRSAPAGKHRRHTVDRFTERRRHHAHAARPLGEAPPRASRRPVARAVPRRARAGRHGAMRRIGSSTSARSRRRGRAPFRPQAAAMQSGRHPHREGRNTCISAAGCRRLLYDLDNDPGETAQPRRGSGLANDEARIRRAPARLAGRASRPVARLVRA